MLRSMYHVPQHQQSQACQVQSERPEEDAADSEELQQALLEVMARLETLAVSMAKHHIPLRTHQT